MDTSTPEALASCKECKRNFRSNNLLQIHHAKHHYIRNCPNCSKIFLHTKKYLKHLRSHLNYCPYQCKICLKSFNKKGDLRNHKIGHDNLEEKICRVCSQKCHDHLSLSRHLMTHGQPPYECPRCVSKFSRLADRSTHLENHVLRCEFCKIPMKSKEVLLYHINEEHRIKKLEYAPVPGDPRLEYPDTVISGKCDSSDSMAESSSSDDESDSSSIGEANANIDSVYDAKHENQFICFICLQLCPTSKLLKYHMKAHDWCPCPYCPKFFICLQDLAMHKRENHYLQCTLSEVKSDLNLHLPKCMLYSNIKSKLNEIVQAVLENKESDFQEELCRKLKEVEKDLGGDCKICFAIKKSLNCVENVCKDTITESCIHYHFPHDLVFDVNLSNSGRSHDTDLFNLSDTLLQSREKIIENWRSYKDICVRFSSDISILKIINFVEALKHLKYPLEPHLLQQLIFFKGIIEDACKLPVNAEMPEVVKDYLQHVHNYLTRISRRHLI
ncbi:zinc finger protein 569 [Trichonephila inaurata madagascariensis]|uniref:Zinc finger protein 569 n=1 Tax=Trichonephila inaurata madagascariensis TaxID=2747483 RepID=A0A8X6XUZ0_9ARAC|nr:zinc finger protein 569 [Trichonephila inaurata madagascariensis]